jgi:hypothetical protein
MDFEAFNSVRKLHALSFILCYELNSVDVDLSLPQNKMLQLKISDSITQQFKNSDGRVIFGVISSYKHSLEKSFGGKKTLPSVTLSASRL